MDLVSFSEENEEKIWDKYLQKCDKLIVIAPYEKEICIKGQRDLFEFGNGHILKDKGIELEKFEDVFDYETNNIDHKAENDITLLFEMNICRQDIGLIVIGSEDNFYKQLAVELCNKYDKKYILENNKVTILN